MPRSFETRSLAVGPPAVPDRSPFTKLSFSVVVPTHGRPEAVRRCLTALRCLDYPAASVEIIVVEDGGATPELAALRGTTRGLPRVVWVSQPHQGPAAARNLGASLATHEFLAFTDDDCCPRPDWLSRLARRLQQAPDAMLGGETINMVSDNIFSVTSQDLVRHFSAVQRRLRAPFFSSNNLAMSRATYQRLAGFDESFQLAGGEDRDFCRRGLDLGLELLFVKEACVDHHHVLSWRSFWRQQRHYGRGAYRYHQKHPGDSSPGLRERLGFYGDMVFHPLREIRFVRRLGVRALLALSQVAVTAGFLAEALGARRGRETLPDPPSDSRLRRGRLEVRFVEQTGGVEPSQPRASTSQETS